MIDASLCDKTYHRPPLLRRSFTSVVIDQLVSNVSVRLADPFLRELWVDCFPNTLDTTVNYSLSQAAAPWGSTYIITGDIHAMWLRDSTWQVNPYLPFASSDPHLLAMLRGLLQRQFYSVSLDAYANAFNYNNNSQGHQDDLRTPPMTPALFEGKYELDSLCCVMHLQNALFRHTSDLSLLTPAWRSAVARILQVLRYQQRATSSMSPVDGKDLYYSFARQTYVPTDTLQHRVGSPGRFTGMVKSAFRPSDDATTLPFNIPSNAFAAVELRATAALLQQHGQGAGSDDAAMAEQLVALAGEIERGIAEYGVVSDPDAEGETIYAFEVDGYGGVYLIDDANVPSLLSLPFLGFLNASDPVYQRTRLRVLSDRNAYWSKGIAGEGIGSPHTGQGYIWPLSIIMQAMTSEDPQEIARCIELLKRSSARTGFIHESYNKDDAALFTRAWFAMANSFFGGMILQILDTFPEVLTQVP